MAGNLQFPFKFKKVHVLVFRMGNFTCQEKIRIYLKVGNQFLNPLLGSNKGLGEERFYFYKSQGLLEKGLLGIIDTKE